MSETNKKCKVIINEACKDEMKEDDITVERPTLMHSLSVPGVENIEKPYHKLRRASQVIISGKCFDF